ncbi:hypothetical protein Hanom_Chr07g00623881 [Helianthus anomalus]
MADQSTPFPTLSEISRMGAVANNAHAPNQPIDEYADGNYTEVGAFHASGTRTAQTVTPTNHSACPSAPMMLGLPEGETPESWFANTQASLNLIYAQLRAQ